ncbi:MAG: hypothetical protein HYZ91_00920 [Candidatus Omnitrophica bacterium]|nr:hypothetical protein [Candidatus Omnitrophota bacterium]
MEFILHFSTAGLYTCIWFVLRAREVNRLLGKTFTPWLWFFVPHVALAQIVALPRFLKQWNVLAERNRTSTWDGWRGTWVFAVIGVTVVSMIGNRVELPGWASAAAMTGWACLFAVLQWHVNHVKEAIGGVTYKGSRRNYSVMEWIAVVVGLPLMLTGSGVLLMRSIGMRHIESLVAGSTYTDPKGIFRFPIAGKGWSVVKIGTHSDGNAVLELQGPLQDMFFLVFKYDRSISLAEMTRSRTVESQELLKGGRCTEVRSLAARRLAVISRIQCVGRELGIPTLITHTLVETDEGLYELRGTLSSVRRSFAVHERDFRRMAGEFEPL